MDGSPPAPRSPYHSPPLSQSSSDTGELSLETNELPPPTSDILPPTQQFTREEILRIQGLAEIIQMSEDEAIQYFLRAGRNIELAAHMALEESGQADPSAYASQGSSSGVRRNDEGAGPSSVSITSDFTTAPTQVRTLSNMRASPVRPATPEPPARPPSPLAGSPAPLNPKAPPFIPSAAIQQMQAANIPIVPAPQFPFGLPHCHYQVIPAHLENPQLAMSREKNAKNG